MVNVYVVPLISPPIVVVAAGGVPVTKRPVAALHAGVQLTE
jgi:hypothetical protein